MLVALVAIAFTLVQWLIYVPIGLSESVHFPITLGVVLGVAGMAWLMGDR